MEVGCFSGNVSYSNVVQTIDFVYASVFLNLKLTAAKQWFFPLNSIVKESFQYFWHVGGFLEAISRKYCDL